MGSKRVLIVGGVAGGASCATRLRRLDERAEIIIFERGPYVAFGSCGLPYYAGDVIKDESKLLVATPELLQSRFNIEVRCDNEVIAIDRGRQEIQVRRTGTGEVYRERYDALVLAPGAAPIRPRIAGIDLPGIFTLRTIPDARAIRAWLQDRRPQTAVVIGAGFIGLEAAENFAKRGIKVTIVEMLDQVMPTMDREMAEFVYEHLIENHVEVKLGDGIASFASAEDGTLMAKTVSGELIHAGVALLAAGVRPETGLAREAGLEIGPRGGIKVDQQMRTSDPCIWAVGDAVETSDFVLQEQVLVPLAGPAQRQGRVAADSICGRDSRFRGTQATAVCGVFGLTVASTGASEKALRRSGVNDYQKVYLHPDNHANYYPGASAVHMKILFSGKDGRILGAQAVGQEGVEKRIDVLAMAMQMKATVFDLEEAELCYAPQFGAARDPINMAGMAAANVIRGDVALASWEELPGLDAYVIDVREPREYATDHVDDAINIPLSQLRQRLHELPKDREIVICCGVGQRSYYAYCALRQYGFKVRSLSGGMKTYARLPLELQSRDEAIARRSTVKAQPAKMSSS
jgi:NADPH-dependent 2,4-dienoyl-CoA reductase/sulfur reductase-like enzyme/rhodanese-related sulfurtransferase